MSTILLVDDAAALSELFAQAVSRELGVEVHTVVSLADVGDALDELGSPDLALVDLSFPQERGSGLDALVEIHTRAPSTRLAIITQGDEWVAQVLRDAWELLPITTVISKSAPLTYQLEAIRAVLATGSAPPDPAIQPLLPKSRERRRRPEQFAALVQHAGHAKLWAALMDADEVSYKSLAEYSGLRLNTLKNYRAQLVGELAAHGLTDPTLREMRAFALRCEPFLRPYVDRALGARRT